MDASSDEVRLWRNEWPTSMFGPPYKGSGEIRYETCERPALSEPGVWMRDAKHAALMRVVEAAVLWGQHNAGWVVGDVESLLPSKRLMGAVDAYLATAPERQGEAPRE